MFNKRLLLSWVIILGIASFCAGCQDSPAAPVVINKNEQDVGSKIDTSGVETQEPSLNDTINISYNKSFASTDGSVNFTIDIDQPIHASSMPIVQVSPHFLTGEDTKRVATSLFPGAEFFEAEPERERNYSQSEIQTKLERWSQYANIDALRDLCGDYATQDYVDLIKSFIEDYTLMYEQSQMKYPHVACEWEMRNSSVYTLTTDELSGASTSDFSDEVSTQFSVDGIPYRLTATTRNKSDYKVNMISCYIYDGICPRDLDDRIFAAKLCRTEEPTQEQMNNVKSKTQDFLEAFDLGQWLIDECYVKSRDVGTETEYLVYVNAVPVLDAAPALRRPQITSLRSQNSYAANYYLTDAQFVFSANGDLISFSLFSPLDVQKVVNRDASVLGIEDLLNRAQAHLELSDAYNYGFGPFLQFINKEVQCNVTISEIEYGLSRIRVQDNDGLYYYVPSILLKGFSEYIGKEDGETYYISESPEVLLVVNAADGTVINATNE